MSDPWEGLLQDLLDLGEDATDPGILTALVTFWRNKAHQQEVTVPALRAAIRDVPAVDWTKSDDLSRYATDVHANLTKKDKVTYAAAVATALGVIGALLVGGIYLAVGLL